MVSKVYYKGCMTCVLHTVRISNVDSVTFVNKTREMVSFELGKEIEKVFFCLFTSVRQRKNTEYLSHCRVSVAQWQSIKGLRLDSSCLVADCLLAKPLNRSQIKVDLVMIQQCCFSNANDFVSMLTLTLLIKINCMGYLLPSLLQSWLQWHP